MKKLSAMVSMVVLLSIAGTFLVGCGSTRRDNRQDDRIEDRGQREDLRDERRD